MEKDNFESLRKSIDSLDKNIESIAYSVSEISDNLDYIKLSFIGLSPEEEWARLGTEPKEPIDDPIYQQAEEWHSSFQEDNIHAFLKDIRDELSECNMRPSTDETEEMRLISSILKRINRSVDWIPIAIILAAIISVIW